MAGTTISGSYTTQVDVDSSQNTVTVTGTIITSNYGLYDGTADPGQVIIENYGTIVGDGRKGIELRSGGAVTNAAVGTVGGYRGVYFGFASDSTLVAEWVAGFHRAHQQLYWWDDPARPVEIVTYRLHAVLPVPRIAPRPEPLAGADPGAALRGTRAIYFAGHERPIDTPVFDRPALRAGNAIEGPAVVESFDTTVLITPGFRAELDPFRNLLLRRQLGGRDA